MINFPLFSRAKYREAWRKSREFVLLRISVPKNNEKTPLAAEQMFAALHGIYRIGAPFQETISFEIVSRNQFIQFYAYTPTTLREFVEGQIFAQYPTAEIEKIDDYITGSAEGKKVAAAEIVLNRDYVYPIKTFVNFEVDPLAAITSVLSRFGPEEECWVQLLLRPVSDDWQKRSSSFVNALKTGTLKSGGVGKEILAKTFQLTRDLVRQITTPPSSGAPSGGGEKEAPSEVSSTGKAIEEKATKLGFAAKIRVLVLSQDETSAREKLLTAIGAFKQFSTINLNGFSGGAVTSDPQIIWDFKNRDFSDTKMIFNIEEIASIYHLPNQSVTTPSIVWAGSKKGEPPANLPIEGEERGDQEITIFGKTNFRHLVKKFGIKQNDRELHMYSIGKTGTGKTTMLENMIIDDIRKGRGVAVVDPHGDLIKKILDFIPQNRLEDVVYFSPADRDYPIAFNPLENVDPDLKNIIASGVVGIFKKIFGESWGPRLEYILRNTILALLDYPKATMLGINRVLTDVNYRRKVVGQIKDPVIKDFFINEYEKYDQKFRTEAIAPIQNKVGQFLSSTTIRNIVGQPKSTINIEEIMNNKRIFLADLSIGKIGEDNSALLGAMMITKIQLAAMGRANIPVEKRIPFYLYVDEFQNFATDSFAVILSEARKYHLNIIMTNQYIAQMPETVASAVFGNVGTLVSFRVGAADANALVREFEPVFDANDLVNLDNYNIYVKMAIAGVTSTPFSSVTLPPAKDSVGLSAEVIRLSRQKYARPRAEVEKEIAEAAEYDQDIVPISTKASRVEIGERVPEKEDKNIFEIEGKRFQKVRSFEEEGKYWYLPIKSSMRNTSFRPSTPAIPQTSHDITPVKQGETVEIKK